jgi:hypothetical protein
LRRIRPGGRPVAASDPRIIDAVACIVNTRDAALWEALRLKKQVGWNRTARFHPVPAKEGSAYFKAKVVPQ